MKIYAIGYEQIDGHYTYYIYTCKFLSERRAIDKGLYYEMKPRFTLAHKNNKTMSGMYFNAEEI